MCQPIFISAISIPSLTAMPIHMHHVNYNSIYGSHLTRHIGVIGDALLKVSNPTKLASIAPLLVNQANSLDEIVYMHDSLKNSVPAIVHTFLILSKKVVGDQKISGKSSI